MSALLKNPVFYVIGYLLLMIPTYVLPYFGSNSLVANGLAAALGRGPMPQWWLHAWALVMLVLLSHLRGKLVGKRYLLAFPLVGAVFDMVPGLSAIPMVPTVMHLLAIILGAISPVSTQVAQDVGDDTQVAPSLRKSIIVAGLMTAATVAGSAWFAINVANSGAKLSQSLTGKPQPVVEPAKPAPKPAPVTVQAPAEAAPPVAAKVQTSLTDASTPSVSPVTEVKRVSAKPVHTKPAPHAATDHRTEKPEPAAPPKVRYINLNDS